LNLRGNWNLSNKDNSLELEGELEFELLGQRCHDGVVIETLLRDRALTYILGTGLVECLSMGEDSDLLMA